MEGRGEGGRGRGRGEREEEEGRGEGRGGKGEEGEREGQEGERRGGKVRGEGREGGEERSKDIHNIFGSYLPTSQDELHRIGSNYDCKVVEHYVIWVRNGMQQRRQNGRETEQTQHHQIHLHQPCNNNNTSHTLRVTILVLFAFRYEDPFQISCPVGMNSI